jgi:hypothetical protein
MFSCSINKRQAKIEFRKEPARTDFYMIEVEDIKVKCCASGLNPNNFKSVLQRKQAKEHIIFVKIESYFVSLRSQKEGKGPKRRGSSGG